MVNSCLPVMVVIFQRGIVFITASKSPFSCIYVPLLKLDNIASATFWFCICFSFQIIIQCVLLSGVMSCGILSEESSQKYSLTAQKRGLLVVEIGALVQSLFQTNECPELSSDAPTWSSVSFSTFDVSIHANSPFLVHFLWFYSICAFFFVRCQSKSNKSNNKKHTCWFSCTLSLQGKWNRFGLQNWLCLVCLAIINRIFRLYGNVAPILNFVCFLESQIPRKIR